MQHDRIVGVVQSRAQLPSRGRAEGAIRSVLETLQKRIHPATAVHLASQLPPEIGEHLRRNLPFEKLSREEFIAEIARREHVEEALAAVHARIVLSVIREAVSPGMFEKVEREIPDDLRELSSRCRSRSKGGKTSAGWS